MLIRFNFFVILIKSILILSAWDSLHPVSAKKSNDLPRKHEPVVHSCSINSNYQSLFAHGLSKCKKVMINKHPGNSRDQDGEKFAKYFTKTVLSIPALKRFLKWHIPVDEQTDIFFNLDQKLLHDLGNPLAECQAGGVKSTLGLYQEFPLQKYFLVVGFTIVTFLVDKNIHLGPNAVQCYAHLLEKALLSSCIVSHNDLFRVLLDAFINYIQALGFDFREQSNLIFELFTTQLLENVDTNEDTKRHW